MKLIRRKNSIQLYYRYVYYLKIINRKKNSKKDLKSRAPPCTKYNLIPYSPPHFSAATTRVPMTRSFGLTSFIHQRSLIIA